MLSTDCLGVVLAGGLSSRMGQDKAQLMRGNTSMLAFSQQVLTDAGVSQVVISGDQHQVPDKFSQLGPVGGIVSVIERYQPSALLIMPVDLPLMTSTALQKLKTVGELNRQACYYQGHQIPLYLPITALLELTLARLFSQQNGKGPAIKQLLAELPQHSIACSNPEYLFNSNTPEQWQQVQTKLRAQFSTQLF
jgi:molybdenum cofactor guanylyltransferase